MPNFIQSRKFRRALGIAAVLFVLAVMLRAAFVGLEIDEEYALSLGYRLVSGDRLFYSMWEPHQLSSLPSAALVWLFMTVTGGTTGLVLFVRLVCLGGKAVLSYAFWREFRARNRTAAALISLILLAYTPKWFLGADYTGQQFHFFMAAFLCLHHYSTRGTRRAWAVAAGAVFSCLGYLAFPQSAASFAALWVGMLVLGRRSGEKRALGIPRGAWLLLGVCALCGCAFLGYALQGLGFDVPLLPERLNLILNDPQYDFTASERLAVLGSQALSVARGLLWPLLAALAVCAALHISGRRSGDEVGRLLWLWGALAAVQCTLRAVRDSSLDERQFLAVLCLAGAWSFWRRRKDSSCAALFWLGFLPGLAAYAMILRSSLISFASTFMYLMPCAVCGALAAVPDASAEQGETAAAPGRWSCLALAAALVFLPVCRLWCVQTTGWQAHNITDTALVKIENGPAKGVYADQTAADMQECLYEALAPYAGQRVLQAIGEQHGTGFLMAQGTLEVAQASVISGTDSDPRFEQYYTELPQKCPDVILYDTAEVRDMDDFHAWIEENFSIAKRYTVTHGTAALEVLVVEPAA